MTVTYNKSSLIGNEVAIDAGFTSVLDNFTVESEFVQSSVVLTLLRDVSMDGTRLECSIAGLASDEIDVLFNNGNNLTSRSDSPLITIVKPCLHSPSFVPGLPLPLPNTMWKENNAGGIKRGRGGGRGRPGDEANTLALPLS